MKTNGFLGRDWLDPEFSYTREEWQTLMDVGFELKRRFAPRHIQHALLRKTGLTPTW